MKKLFFILCLSFFSLNVFSQELEKKQTHYPSGKMKEEFSVDKDGKRQERYLKYFENGTLQHDFQFKDGLKNGKCVSYFQNGKKQDEGTYVNGELKGDYKAWDEAGNLLESSN